MTEMLILLLFPALMAYAACSDLVSMTISNRVCLTIVAAFFIVAPALGLPLGAMAWHVAAGVIVLFITFAMFSAGWIGGGDAKLAAATALWLGWDKLFDYGVYGGIYGGALTLALLMFRTMPLPHFTLGAKWLLNLHHPKTGVPYGIALAAAGLTAYSGSPLWSIAVSH